MLGEFGSGTFKLSSSDSLYESKVTNPNANAPTMLVVEPGSGGLPTFKAGASHPFGVVFYDSRGRCSNVNPLGSAYVPWYSERPSGEEGPTGTIKCTITGSAPEGATSFRFVYGGNTTVSNFTQYSTGGGVYFRVIRRCLWRQHIRVPESPSVQPSILRKVLRC